MNAPTSITLAGHVYPIKLPRALEREELVVAYLDRSGGPYAPLRVCAAAIGLATMAAPKVPSYSACKCSPLEYGGNVYEALVDVGVSPTEIVERGLEILQLCGVRRLPREEEVKAAEDFSGAGEGPRTSSPSA